MNTPTGERVAVVAVNGAFALALALIALVGLTESDQGTAPAPYAVTKEIQP